VHNLSEYDSLGPDGTVTPGPIDDTVDAFAAGALSGPTAGGSAMRSARTDIAPVHTDAWRLPPGAKH
jgi:hypothetical protein